MPIGNITNVSGQFILILTEQGDPQDFVAEVFSFVTAGAPQTSL